ncbi:MAG TPA: MFS transporter [Streptosporangiaceae bacterium]|nr:MFS transporter [Streptosporangiaceae bacterium]
MADQAISRPHVPSLALAEPTQHVRVRWIFGLTLASLGMWMANQTPSQVLLALQLQDITPRHKIVALGVVTAVNAVSSALATPIVGALSDRTAHGQRLGRFSGRRHRWTLVMVLLAGVCVGLLAKAGTVVAVAVLWFLFGAFQNGEYATLSAAVPDHVPVRQRATVSGWVGMPIALGLVLGTVLVVDVLNQDLLTGYITLAVLMVLLALPFVLFTPDHPLAPEHREPFSWRRVASSYWISPREYPDFGWAWLTRFLTTLAIAMGTLYLLYFLRDKLHYARLFPGHTAADGLLILILIYTGGVVLASIVGGIISDRRGRRKMLVTVSGLLMGVAALLLTFWETWPSALAAAVLFGIGFGCYIAVDQALITQVLPKAHNRAKDLGIINIAIVTPYAIGPAIAAPLVSLAGYPALFGATAVVAAAAAIGVWQIKSVS